jgi:hypothetical protein
LALCRRETGSAAFQGRGRCDEVTERLQVHKVMLREMVLTPSRCKSGSV